MTSTADNITEVVRSVLAAAGLTELMPTRDEGGVRDLNAMPYTVCRESISTARSAASARDVERRTELIQIDLFQNRRDAPDDASLMWSIWRALAAAQPAALQAHKVIRLLPVHNLRRYDRTTQVVTESLTVRVNHSA